VFALLGDGALRMLPRGIDEYLERRERMERAAEAASAPAGGTVPAASGAGTKTVSAADARAAKKELQKIERQLDRVSDKEKALHAAIAEHATDFAKVAELDAELRDLGGQREELEMRWLELAEEV
jgi:ATP-binding cassette subfamily F protein uup